MKYSCILIDHDDTAVDSTPSIHHPAHVEQMKRLGKTAHTKTLEEWFSLNYHPGFHHFMEHELRLSTEEEALCYQVWRDFTRSVDPPFFPGFLRLMGQLSDQGASIIVVSHSEEDIIRRHYERQQDLPGFMPREIFGWTGNPLESKPYSWPVDQVMQRYGFSREEIIMIDDLKPGILMARQAGIAAMGAGWSHRIAEIQADLRKEADVFCATIEEAAAFLL